MGVGGKVYGEIGEISAWGLGHGKGVREDMVNVKRPDVGKIRALATYDPVVGMMLDRLQDNTWGKGNVC